jgi:hypothetical protein
VITIPPVNAVLEILSVVPSKLFPVANIDEVVSITLCLDSLIVEADSENKFKGIPQNTDACFYVNHKSPSNSRGVGNCDCDVMPVKVTEVSTVPSPFRSACMVSPL